MKKILFLLMIFISSVSFAQIQIADGYGFQTATTAYLNGLNKAKADIFFDANLDKHVWWTGTEYKILGSNALGSDDQTIALGTTRIVNVDGNIAFYLNETNSSTFSILLEKTGGGFDNFFEVDETGVSFNSFLPKSILLPTVGSEFTNKTYVDGLIASAALPLSQATQVIPNGAQRSIELGTGSFLNVGRTVLGGFTAIFSETQVEIPSAIDLIVGKTAVNNLDAVNKSYLDTRLLALPSGGLAVSDQVLSNTLRNVDITGTTDLRFNLDATGEFQFIDTVNNRIMFGMSNGGAQFQFVPPFYVGPAPTLDTHLTPKSYVDNAIATYAFSDDQTDTEVASSFTPSNYTASTATVRGQLQGIDTALGGAIGTDDQTATEVAYDNTTSGLTATNAQSAIDEIDLDVEALQADLNQTNTDLNSNISVTTTNSSDIADIVAELAAPSSSVFNFDTKTANYTAVLSDAEDNKIIFLDYNNEDFTIPAGVFSQGQAIRVQSIGAGLAQIIGGTNVTMALGDLQLDILGSSVTVARTNNTTPEIWYPIGGYINATSSVSTLPNYGVGTELVRTGTAYSFPPNEADAISYVSGYEPTGATATSVANTNNGYSTFVGEVVATSATNGRARHRITGLTTGQTLRYYFLSRMTVGTNGRFNSSINVTSGPNILNISNTGWELRTGTGTVTATGDVQFDVNATDNADGSIGDTMQYLLSIKVE